MKTYTITLHDTDNCGSSLQAYALQQFLLKNGVCNEIIDYVPEYIKHNGSLIRSIAKKFLYCVPTIQKNKKFRCFKNTYLNFTKTKYTSYQELKEAGLNADCFITGSDQLWNDSFMCGRDPAYYLGFTQGNKISYAVSLGKENISDDNKKSINEYAADFKWISVREPSSVKAVADVVNVPVMHVCDPVFLNKKEEYSAISRKVVLKDKYMLVYLAQAIDKEALNKMLSMLKNRMDCKVVLIGTCVKRCDCDIHLKSVSPEEFLYLVENAEYVVSNSFHATMFSLLFEKQFVTLLPKENGKRITSVLEQVGLQEYGLESPRYVEKMITSDEYKEVTYKLQEFAKKSGDALLEQLQKLQETI